MRLRVLFRFFRAKLAVDFGFRGCTCAAVVGVFVPVTLTHAGARTYTCTGQVRSSGPEPFRLGVTAEKGMLRVAMRDTVLGRVEAPVLSVPVDLDAVFPGRDRDVWVGLHGSEDSETLPDIGVDAVLPSTPDGAGVGAGAGAGDGSN